MPRIALTQEEVIKRGKENGVTVLRDYRTSKHKIDVRCDICYAEWSVYPNKLFSGSKCPKCKGDSNCNIKGFCKVNDRIGENVKIIVYNGYNTYSTVQCVLCEHEWKAYPCYLISQVKSKTVVVCPMCKNEKPDWEYFRKIIDEVSLSCETLPYTKDRLHKFFCMICGRSTMTTLESQIKNVGCVSCEKCPSSRLLKYQHYAECKGMKYTRRKIINTRYGNTKYINIWTCPNNHIVRNGPELAELKNTDVKTWCIDCNWRRMYNTETLYNIAIEKNVIYCGGPYTGLDSKYIFKCKRFHIIEYTYREILDDKWKNDCIHCRDDMIDIEKKCKENKRETIILYPDLSTDDLYIQKLLDEYRQKISIEYNKHICNYRLNYVDSKKYKVCCEGEIRNRKHKLRVSEERYKREHLVELEEMKCMDMTEDRYIELKSKMYYNVSNYLGIQYDFRLQHIKKYQLY